MTVLCVTMQMSEPKIHVNILSALGGWERQRFSKDDKIHAAELIFHLTHSYGEGTLRDSEGAEIVPDGGNYLQPGVYFFIIDQDKSSSAPGGWRATQPNERHLLFNHGGLGKLEFVTGAAIDAL